MTPIGNSADRVYTAMRTDFELCTQRMCERLAVHCESPIEVMLSATILIGVNLAQPGFAVLVPPGVLIPENCGLAVCPQYRWQNYRFDFAMFFKGVSVFVECDGHDFHERTKEQAAHDRQKDRAAQEGGYPILRFTGSEIFRDPVSCCNQVMSFLLKTWDRAEENK